MPNILKTLIVTITGFFAINASAGAAQKNTGGEINLGIANNKVAFRLYSQTAVNNSNVLISPYSIYSALSVLNAGAETGTKEQLNQYLGIKGDDGAYMAALAGMADSWKSKEFTLKVANALFIQRDYKINREYIKKSEVLNAEVRTEDFTDPDESAAALNKWVEQKTGGKIKDIVSPNDMRAAPKLIIGNAVYFLGKWVSPFKPENTSTEDFTLEDNSVKKTKMMYSADYFEYHETADMQLLSMPYKGDKLAMAVMLPKGKLAALEQKLANDSSLFAEWTGSVKDQKAKVKLPKFKVERFYTLAPQLKQDIPDAFDSQKADFSGINDHSAATDTLKALVVGNVLHKAFIAVDEEGTEAAAATIVTVPLGAALNPDKPVEFYADRPFMFAIYDVDTKLALFVGRLADPGAL